MMYGMDQSRTRLVRLAYKNREPCPFCGGRWLSMKCGKRTEPSSERPWTIVSSWAVECQCGARGPWAETELEALNAWNRRPVA